MKRLLCLLIALIVTCSVSAFASAAFVPSVFEGNDGFSYKKGSLPCCSSIFY